MNKQELIGAVAKRLDVDAGRAAEITDLFFAADGVIASELRRGGKVAISGFGNFELRRRAAREGRNPRTGKAIDIQRLDDSRVPGRQGAEGARRTGSGPSASPAGGRAPARRVRPTAGARDRRDPPVP